jgi:hypothetical protein
VIDRRFIGKEYPVTEYEIGREKMKEYANAINDPNPHYVAGEVGKKSRYGDNIAPPLFASVYNLHGPGAPAQLCHAGSRRTGV